jgi:peptidoglycan/LPS O-acetylase OafA/YrhL
MMTSPGGTRLSLAQRFDPRRNNLSVLRLGFAVVVAMVHANAIGWGNQPEIGETELGELAVDGFFVVSGFLVVRSALRLPTLRRYAWHRALRILPGFWVCLLVVAFVAAPLVAWLKGRSPAVVFSGDESAFGYVARNALLLVRQWDVAGLAAGGSRSAINGALWTLFYEALCYAAVAVLVVAVPPIWRKRVVAASVGALWSLVLATELGVVDGGPEHLPRFLLLFGLGALGWLFANRIRFTPYALLAAATMLAVGLLALDDYRAIGAAGFAYLLLWVVVALPLRVEPPVDLSYGLYVYHWPVEQVLLAAGVAVFGPHGFTMLALAVAAVLAAASWRWIEKPALARKNAPWVDGGRTSRRAHVV